MGAHLQEAHAHLIPIKCQLCKIVLPNSTAMEPHLQWHGDPNRSSIPHQYAEECLKCHMFFPYGPESNSHRAFCIMKLAPEVRDSHQASETPEPVVVTHQGHKSTSAQALKQMIRETLRSVTHTNAVGMCQATDTGQCPNNISHTVESDEQDIEIIPGDTRYWENWESEVQYNSGRSNIREVSPQLPSEASNQSPSQVSIAEQENNCGSSFVEHNDE